MWSMRRVLAIVAALVILALPGSGASADRCDAADVKRMIRKFAVAYSGGNLKELDTLFVKGRGFRSFDVHPIERMEWE